MNRIKIIRTDRNLTQQELALKMGTTQQTIARWESEQTDIPVGKIKDLSIVLNCNVDELIGAEQIRDKKRLSTYALVDHDSPYGTAELSIVGVKETRQYPIDKNTYKYITSDFQMPLVARLPDSGVRWFNFTSLDNKLVFMNAALIRRLRFTADEMEEMPNYEHPEVYKSLSDEYLDTRFKDDSILSDRCSRMVDDLGFEEAEDQVGCIKLIYADGSEERLVMIDQGARDIDSFDVDNLYADSDRAPFHLLNGDGEALLMNATLTAVVEVPLESYRHYCRTLDLGIPEGRANPD